MQGHRLTLVVARLIYRQIIQTDKLRVACESFSLINCLFAGETKKQPKYCHGIFTGASNPSMFSKVTAGTNRSICKQTTTLRNLTDDSCMNRFSEKNYPKQGTLFHNYSNTINSSINNSPGEFLPSLTIGVVTNQ